MRKTLEERFWDKVEKKEGCWGWIGAKTQGYGQLRIGGRNDGMIRAPRLSYQIHFGEIPEGMVVRHKCDNPECTNPDHLEIGTHADNMSDLVDRRRHHKHSQTHCINGHEFNKQNTYTHPKTGHRYCKVCKAAKSKDAHRKKRGDKFGIATYKVRTHCKHGHEFTNENTYIRPDGYKECRTCRDARVSKFYLKNKS